MRDATAHGAGSEPLRNHLERVVWFAVVALHIRWSRRARRAAFTPLFIGTRSPPGCRRRAHRRTVCSAYFRARGSTSCHGSPGPPNQCAALGIARKLKVTLSASPSALTSCQLSSPMRRCALVSLRQPGVYRHCDVVADDSQRRTVGCCQRPVPRVGARLAHNGPASQRHDALRWRHGP